MTAVCPQLPPLTKTRIREAINAGRVVTADAATEHHDIPKATLNDWVGRGWLKPALPTRPRVYLLDDLYDLRAQLAALSPPRDTLSGKFVKAGEPG